MDIKIVIQLKGTKAIVGVQASGCDPVFEMVEGDLATILSRAEAIVATAQVKWKTSPKNPSIDLPKPAPVKEAAAAKSSAKLVPSPAKDTTQAVMS